jgi:GAF domain-containing protein
MALTRYKAVADMAVAISSSTEYGDVLATVAEQAATAFEVSECCLYEYSPGAVEALPVALWGVEATPADQAYVGVAVTFADTPAMQRCLVDAEAVETRVSDSLLAPNDKRQMDEWDEKSVLWVPLLFGGDVIGCMEIIEKRYVRPFTDYDREFAATIAALAAMAIHTARMRHLLQVQERKLKVLLGASREVASAEGFEDVLATIARTTAEALEAEACYISTYDRERDVTVCHVVWEPEGISDPEVDNVGGVYTLDDHSDDRRALETGEVIEQRLSDEALPQAARADLEAWHLRTLLIVPAVFQGQPVGLLEIAQVSAERHFSDDEVELARALGEQAAAVMARRGPSPSG